MRQILPTVVVAVLAPLPLLGESAMCEYRHPAHPNWDFFASCSVTETEESGKITREVNVTNGSRFTTREEAGSTSVNGLAAQSVGRDDAQCWQTDAENELICIYPADTIVPAAPVPPPGAEDPGFEISTSGSIAFGGGTPGYCLLAEAGTLVEQGACAKRENCLEIEAGAGMSCLMEYVWKSGRTTEMASAEDWTTLDGAPVIKGDPGCVVDAGTGLLFCFSKTAMTPATHPVLAPPAVATNETPPAGVAAPEGESEAAPAAGAE